MQTPAYRLPISRRRCIIAGSAGHQRAITLLSGCCKQLADTLPTAGKRLGQAQQSHSSPTAVWQRVHRGGH